MKTLKFDNHGYKVFDMFNPIIIIGTMYSIYFIKIDLELKDLNMKIDLPHWGQKHQVDQFILLVLLNH